MKTQIKDIQEGNVVSTTAGVDIPRINVPHTTYRSSKQKSKGANNLKRKKYSLNMKQMLWDKICKDGSKNMSILQNNIQSISRYVKILMDSGASVSIIHDSFVCTNKFNIRKTSANKWSTMAGSFSTPCKVEVQIKLPQLNFTAHFFASFSHKYPKK